MLIYVGGLVLEQARDSFFVVTNSHLLQTTYQHLDKSSLPFFQRDLLEMLEVGIIGAGIAGFASAIALSRAGHRVEIFEKSRFSNETGAGIISAPNGSRVLSRWGFDFEKAGAVDCKRVTRIHADTLEIDSEEYFKGIEDKYGERWCFLHRADFHGGLQALAEAQHPKVTTHLGVTVDNVDIEAGIISLADGRMFTKDLVIVADGCRSAFIDKFIGRK